jgi:hypothetical protein
VKTPPNSPKDDTRFVLSSDHRRIITDDQGREWSVREIADTHYDRRDSRSLVFERPDIVRRLRRFPRDWRGLTDEALYKLSESI